MTMSEYDYKTTQSDDILTAADNMFQGTFFVNKALYFM